MDVEDEEKLYSNGPFCDTRGYELKVSLREERFSKEALSRTKRLINRKNIEICVHHDGSLYFVVMMNGRSEGIVHNLKDAYKRAEDVLMLN